MPPETNQNSTGPVVAIIIVLAVIILGGLYFWIERGSSGRAGSDAESLESIEAELEDTELENIGAELEAI